MTIPERKPISVAIVDNSSFYVPNKQTTFSKLRHCVETDVSVPEMERIHGQDSGDLSTSNLVCGDDEKTCKVVKEAKNTIFFPRSA